MLQDHGFDDSSALSPKYKVMPFSAFYLNPNIAAQIIANSILGYLISLSIQNRIHTNTFFSFLRPLYFSFFSIAVVGLAGA